MDDKHQLLAFLSEQKYMTIAVTLNDGTPWATPVRIKNWDGKNVFEWDSKLDTEHSRAIERRPQVAISMWTPDSDSTIQFGFYAKATADLVSSENGFGRYKATVTRAWVNDATFIKREVLLDA